MGIQKIQVWPRSLALFMQILASSQGCLIPLVWFEVLVEEFVHFAELMVLERQVQAMVDFCFFLEGRGSADRHV